VRGERRGEERGSKQEVQATRRADGEKEWPPMGRRRGAAGGEDKAGVDKGGG